LLSLQQVLGVVCYGKCFLCLVKPLMGRQHGLPARAASLLGLIIIIIKVGSYQQLHSRASEKLMGGLKLQQKRNGVELSTELMVASIRREFNANPNRVIEVIHERLSPAVVKRLLADLPKWRDEADVRTALRC
jgi:hypothetical protein